MFRNIATAAVIALSTAQLASAQNSDETTAWEAAKSSGASADVFEFVENYPDGTYSAEAKAYLIDLLWKELDGEGTATAASQADAPEQETVTVTFSAPLTVGTPEVVGKSLEELIEGYALFPPIEGLPEELWKDQTCSNCHEWEQANLCTQANSYLSDRGGENLSKTHPYGGAFKLNLRNWAQSGCE